MTHTQCVPSSSARTAGLLELSLPDLINGALKRETRDARLQRSLQSSVGMWWAVLTHLSVEAGVCYVGKLVQASRRERLLYEWKEEALGGHSR